MTVSDKITDILNYYKENPGCDPNVREYMELCHDLGTYLKNANINLSWAAQTPNNDNPIASAVHEKFLLLSEQFEKKLLENNLGIDKNSPIYAMYLQASHGEYTGVGDMRPQLFAEVGGVALYIAQQKRDNPEFKYDNTEELERLSKMNQHMLQTYEWYSHTQVKQAFESIEAEYNKESKIQEPIEVKEEAKMSVSERMTNILNYYKENPGCDPNMFEFVELCYDMVQYLNKEAPSYGIYNVSNSTRVLSTPETYPIPRAVYDKFCILNDQFKAKLLGNNLGITEESPLYQMYQNVSRGVGTYSAYPDNELLQKLGGVSLFIAQQKRDNPDFVYNNETELNYINELDEKLHDPHSIGYSIKAESETEWKNVEPEPSPRRLLIEEITTEFKKSQKTV